MKTSPCKDCSERTQGCRSKCSRYKEFVTEHGEYMAKVNKVKETNQMIRMHKRDMVYKAKKRRVK